MPVAPAYIPGPQQTNQQAQARATALGVGIAPRIVPPVYQPFVSVLPGVIAEGAGLVVYVADNGTLTAQQVTTAVAPIVAAQTAADTAAANQQTLLSRAQTALTNNEAFLAIASPTTAQTLTQVKALTRQIDALIRLGQGLITDISDT